MIGYNLYLKGEVDTLTLYEEEPLFLYLSYGTMAEAEQASAVLERVYGKGSIEIDVRFAERNLAE